MGSAVILVVVTTALNWWIGGLAFYRDLRGAGGSRAHAGLVALGLSAVIAVWLVLLGLFDEMVMYHPDRFLPP